MKLTLDLILAFGSKPGSSLIKTTLLLMIQQSLMKKLLIRILSYINVNGIYIFEKVL